jgi:hypothetical protein
MMLIELIGNARKECTMIIKEKAAVNSEMDRVLLSIDEQTGIFDILNRVAKIIDEQNKELKRLSDAVDKMHKSVKQED